MRAKARIAPQSPAKAAGFRRSMTSSAIERPSHENKREKTKSQTKPTKLSQNTWSKWPRTSTAPKRQRPEAIKSRLAPKQRRVTQANVFDFLNASARLDEPKAATTEINGGRSVHINTKFRLVGIIRRWMSSDRRGRPGNACGSCKRRTRLVPGLAYGIRPVKYQ